VAIRASAGLTTFSPAEGRTFALAVGGAFATLSVLLGWRGHPIGAAIPGGAAMLLGLAGLVIPGRLGGVQRAWLALALAMSRVVTPVVMTVIYFLVITPIALMRRVAGRNPVAVRRSSAGYWHTRPPAERKSNLLRQF
jgi:hypothetical protein